MGFFSKFFGGGGSSEQEEPVICLCPHCKRSETYDFDCGCHELNGVFVSKEEFEAIEKARFAARVL